MCPLPTKTISEPKPAEFRVLLLEEDARSAELYADLIRELGNCKVDVMSQVESSFDWVGRSNYHLVVVDASGGVRPETGLGLLEQIKRLSPITSVILLSDEGTVEQAVAAIRMGAEDFLKKPFKLEAFQLAVKRGLDRKAVFGEDTGASGFFNLLNACQMVSASLDRERILEIVESYLQRELGSEHGAIYVLRDSRPVRVEIPTMPGESRRDRAMEEVLDIALAASNPIPKMEGANEFCRYIEKSSLTPGLFVFRFGLGGASQYYCVCLSPQRASSREELESRLRLLKAQIEVTGRNIEEYQGVQNLVYVDDATGLYNTRYLNTILDREIAQAETTQKSFAILFIDADHFKRINDTHGHLIGTRILNELGNRLKKLVRDSDTVFRYGGDEFVAVLSPCDLAMAQTVAERIRRSVEELPFLQGQPGLEAGVAVTVSIGVALFPQHAASKKAIIEAADHAMYSAKRLSRNMVSLFDANEIEAEKAPVPAGLRKR